MAKSGRDKKDQDIEIEKNIGLELWEEMKKDVKNKTKALPPKPKDSSPDAVMFQKT
ncbi:MAG: hypothetical protein AAB723_01790 [Patescibacteria group bacterium]